MKTVLQASAALALGAAAYLCITLALALKTTAKHVDMLTMQAGDSLHQLNLEVQEAHRATLEIALAASEVRKASHQERTYLGALNQQTETVLRQASGTLAAIQYAASTMGRSEAQIAASLVQSTDALRPLLSSATVETQDLQVATRQLGALLADPALPSTLSSVEHTAAHVDSTSSDIQQAVSSYLHPTWPQRVWGWTLEIMGHVLNPF